MACHTKALKLDSSPKPSFCFVEPFRNRLAYVLSIIVLLLNQSVLEIQGTNDGWTSYFLVESIINGSITYDKLSRSQSGKAALDHRTITTVFDSWYDNVFVKCCVSFRFYLDDIVIKQAWQ